MARGPGHEQDRACGEQRAPEREQADDRAASGCSGRSSHSATRRGEREEREQELEPQVAAPERGDVISGMSDPNDQNERSANCDVARRT